MSVEERAGTKKHNSPANGRALPDSEGICAADVHTWLQRFIEPGQVTELRALRVSTPTYRRPHTEAGFFDYDHLLAMAKEALCLSQSAQGVYFVMNPLKPEILARCANRVKVAETGDQAGDQHILRRRWLLVDVDPAKVSGVSATDEEKAEAWQVMRAVRKHLTGLGWPKPILADSGNGYHAFYRIDLPAEDGGIVERCLKALAQRFDTDAAKIDQKVFNPARIAKVPGTWARKGDDTSDRPHRQGGVL